MTESRKREKHTSYNHATERKGFAFEHGVADAEDNGNNVDLWKETEGWKRNDAEYIHEEQGRGKERAAFL